MFPRIPEISRHSRLLYWLLAQNCLSKVAIFLQRLALTDLDTKNSDSNFSKLHFNYPTFLLILARVEINLSRQPRAKVMMSSLL